MGALACAFYFGEAAGNVSYPGIRAVLSVLPFLLPDLAEQRGFRLPSWMPAALCAMGACFAAAVWAAFPGGDAPEAAAALPAWDGMSMALASFGIALPFSMRSGAPAVFGASEAATAVCMVLAMLAPAGFLSAGASLPGARGLMAAVMMAAAAREMLASGRRLPGGGPAPYVRHALAAAMLSAACGAVWLI